jgi:HK97 family phage portal protein
MGILGKIGSWLRSLENPQTTLADPEPWLFDAFGGGPTSSGVRVKSALALSAVWRAVNLISSDVGKLPLHVYHRLPEGGKERAKGHPAYKLLRRMPFPGEYLTAFQFRKMLTAHALLTGNGYAWINRAATQAPAALHPLSPDLTHAVRVDGVVAYVTRVNDREVAIPAEDMLHIRGLAFDGLSGYSVVTVARESLGLGLAQQQYSSVYFKNAARPSMVIQHPGVMSEKAQENFLRSWNRVHGGLDNAHRAALLQEGAEVKPITINAKDSQLLESREYGLRDVANWFGVPAHKIGDTARTSYSSLEQENQSYLDQGLDPWLVPWEEECTAKLISDRQRGADSFFAEFERNALVRADLPARFNGYNTGIQGGWLSRNEVRERENLNPIPGGDVYLTPLNMSPNTPPPPPEPEPEPEDDDEPIRALIVDCGHRFAKRLLAQASRRLNDKDRFDEFLNNLPLLQHSGCTDFLAAYRVAGGDHRALARSASEAVCAIVIDELRARVTRPGRPEARNEFQVCEHDVRDAIEEHFNGAQISPEPG